MPELNNSISRHDFKTILARHWGTHSVSSRKTAVLGMETTTISTRSTEKTGVWAGKIITVPIHPVGPRGIVKWELSGANVFWKTRGDSVRPTSPENQILLLKTWRRTVSRHRVGGTNAERSVVRRRSSDGYDGEFPTARKFNRQNAIGEQLTRRLWFCSRL